MSKLAVSLALVLAVAARPAAAQAPSADQQAVLATVHAFHEAVARGDSLAALGLLADDVMVLESGGLETRAEYRGQHLPGDIAFAQAVPTTRGEPSVVVLGDAAWVTSTSRTTGTFRSRSVNSVGVELVVLSRGAEGWRIRAVHWSSRTIRTP